MPLNYSQIDENIAAIGRVRKNLYSKGQIYQEAKKDLAAWNTLLDTTKISHSDTVELVATDTQCVELVKGIFDHVSGSGFQFLERLINEALSMVFVDEVYTIKIRMGERGGEKAVEFYLFDGIAENPLSESTGGGVQVLVAFVLRIYYILRTGMRRIVFMDETFSQLSPHYLESLMRFFKLLVNQFQFKFLWVSHSPYISEYADSFYEVYKGKLYKRK